MKSLRLLTEQYLEILKANSMKVNVTNENKKKCFRRTKMTLETRLHSRRSKGTNTWRVALARYSGYFLNWTKQNSNIWIRKYEKELRSDTEKLYMKKNK